MLPVITKANEDGARLLDVAALDEVARRVGEEEEADAEDQAPGEPARGARLISVTFLWLGRRATKRSGCAERERTHWMPIGMRYEPESARLLVKLLIIAASIRPIVMANW